VDKIANGNHGLLCRCERSLRSNLLLRGDCFGLGFGTDFVLLNRQPSQ
jgi:hypothetical protein